MEKIVNMVAEKAGISPSQAETAVRTVASFLKDKLPPGMAGQVDAYLTGKGPEGGAAGLADKFGGM
jgi:uncharacterized protein (DUF2267 family)